MVYEWEGKRELCYQMYIVDKKGLDEIMEYMKNTYQFAPSKRAFQTQFKRWGFPSKQNPAHKNTQLVARVKELWERNVCQRDMLKILNDEGYDIKERELMRVRAKNRWLLRVPNGMKSQAAIQSPIETSVEDGVLSLQHEMYNSHDDFPGDDNQPLTEQPSVLSSFSPSLSPEVLAKRKERLERLQAESAERWATKKRRRRTRGWAGLPADPPGPPRFPSETTLDESKQYLSLDAAMYRQIRDEFQRICQEAGFLKKTIAGPERWQEAKNRLIRESPHLRSVFYVDPSMPDDTQLEAKNLALDVVCTDVTKRMRTLESRMTIAEAKNALGINPEESRQIRHAFYSTLKADHFTSKLEAGDEHWNELKQQWIQGSELLQRILAPGLADPNHTTKVKAIEVLCRDVMKRLRDDQAKRDPLKKRTSSSKQPKARNHNNTENATSNAYTHGISNLASEALASASMASNDLGEMQIDPSLLQAANDTSLARALQQNSDPAFNYVDTLLQNPSIPVYFRISPQSQNHTASRTWIGKISSTSLVELQNLVQAKYPDSIVTRVEGVEKDERGGEVLLLIEEDDELDAYLSHMHGKKASFLICLSPKV
ncbi:hypothetical protein TCE0_050f18432 [Talaromyces pinophilus]|uniref:Uncharacterized protein n=1 Tax=Talaromyces pinophilus TaxID=128442 RepID=A0A0B8MZC4_TALPI|nr:hypothetical protein DPV78_011368 [Talaromyces pinophilus]PCH07088.1 Hypothetical protein PENO1_013810 [Penicillium occitanis (nom. inval.)]PCH08297.1 hypothetical protein PENOC_015070 [Penicillium occitanis (nom. inval.)]GAM43540.1 hypothetical protein TCE0_050f18432 [Talaromyces pinophilus]